MSDELMRALIFFFGGTAAIYLFYMGVRILLLPKGKFKELQQCKSDADYDRFWDNN